MLAACTVQVYQVEASYAGILEPERHVQRIVAVGLADVVVTFGQAYALAVYYVNCRNYVHCSQMSRKFLRIRSPVAPLFSGWNWVA